MKLPRDKKVKHLTDSARFSQGEKKEKDKS